METVIRVVVFYLFILFGLRILGKREFGQLSPMELVTLLLIPELVSQSLVREDFSLTNGLIAVATLFALVFGTSLLAQASKRFEQVVASSPTVLAHHGRLVPANMHKERVTAEEIFSEMHKAGLERLDQVQWAVLESDGTIAIVPAESGGGGARQQEKKPVG